MEKWFHMFPDVFSIFLHVIPLQPLVVCSSIPRSILYDIYFTLCTAHYPAEYLQYLQRTAFTPCIFFFLHDSPQDHPVDGKRNSRWGMFPDRSPGHNWTEIKRRTEQKLQGPQVVKQLKWKYKNSHPRTLRFPASVGWSPQMWNLNSVGFDQMFDIRRWINGKWWEFRERK